MNCQKQVVIPFLLFLVFSCTFQTDARLIKRCSKKNDGKEPDPRKKSGGQGNKTHPKSESSGGCKSKWPEAGKVVTLNEAKELDSHFDCENKFYKNPNGYVFIIKEGGSLSNCFFEQSGQVADVIRVIAASGKVLLENLYFFGVGDDGVTISDNAEVTLKGGGMMNANNKAREHNSIRTIIYKAHSAFRATLSEKVQFNGYGKVIIEGGCFENVHVVIQSCGTCVKEDTTQGRTIEISDITVHNVSNVCAINVNVPDKCTVKGVYGKPETTCTILNQGYGSWTKSKAPAVQNDVKSKQDIAATS